MRANCKAMRLVAQPLDKIKRRITRRELERVASRHKKRLTPCIAIWPLGHTHQRHALNTQFSQNGFSRFQLPPPAIDDNKIGPARDVTVTRRAFARIVSNQPLEPALQNLAQWSTNAAHAKIALEQVKQTAVAKANAALRDAGLMIGPGGVVLPIPTV